MDDLHPQDRILIITALARYAGDPRDLDAREERAWELAERIGTDLSISVSEAVRQLDAGRR